MIEIDGATLEGGGQLLRTALSLAAITKTPCRVFNIRKNRPNPGLAVQHLLAAQALCQLCQGRLEGDSLGSEEIKFYPGQIRQGRISVNIPTAASITLILQALIPVALFAATPVNPVRKEADLYSSPPQGMGLSNGVKIVFCGGATDTFFAPTMDYFRYVFLKILEKAGSKTEISVLKRGYWPEGGAKAEVIIFPTSTNTLKALNLTNRGKLNKILIISGASESLKDKKVAERQIIGAREVLGKLKLPIEERTEYYTSQCPGSQICLAAEFENTVIGADNLGKLGKMAEDMGREAALELLKEERSGACLDKHLADQILPYMPFMKGGSSVSVSEITSHCQTTIWVIEKFLSGRMEIKDNLIKWVPGI